MPKFLGEEYLEEIFFVPEPTYCMLELRNSLAELGMEKCNLQKGLNLYSVPFVSPVNNS